jgi:hypothetical protein
MTDVLIQCVRRRTSECRSAFPGTAQLHLTLMEGGFYIDALPYESLCHGPSPVRLFLAGAHRHTLSLPNQLPSPFSMERTHADRRHASVLTLAVTWALVIALSPLLLAKLCSLVESTTVLALTRTVSPILPQRRDVLSISRRRREQGAWWEWCR